jgi:hypothetical protein
MIPRKRSGRTNDISRDRPSPEVSSPSAYVARLLDTNVMLYVACTGAASGTVQWLWSVPGASKYLLGFHFPYHTLAFDAYVSRRPERYCSVEAAGLLADASYERGHAIAGPSANVVGVGATAAVKTRRVRRGRDQLNVAVRLASGSLSGEFCFREDQTRLQQGHLCDLLVLNSIFFACDLPQVSLPVDVIDSSHLKARDGSMAHVCLEPLKIGN